jgi:hypothetical protein
LDFRNGISFVIFVFQKTQNYEILEETNSITYGSTWIAFVGCNVENFYLLKIHLNLFEIPNQVLKFENLIET